VILADIYLCRFAALIYTSEAPSVGGAFPVKQRPSQSDGVGSAFQ